MATLPTNFKDDILDTSVNTRRRYRVYENTDGTIELEDVTEYSQVGDEFGAGQINATNTEVNKKFDKNMLVRDLDTINAITKEGYAPDALALKEVNQSLQGLDKPIFIDTSNMLDGSPENNDTSVFSYTATQDCYFSYTYFHSSKNALYIDDVLIVATSSANNQYILCWSGYLKQGQTVKWSTGGRWSVFALK